MESETNTGLCSGVVLDLMSGLDAGGFYFLTDNYYASPQLSLTLYKKGVNKYGTARTNRKGFPKGLIKTKKEKTVRLS